MSNAKSELAGLPNFIHCSITGLRFAVRREVLLQRIKQAGGLERLKKTYVSRDCRRLLKEGKTIEQIRAELGYDPQNANNNITLEVAHSSSSMARVRHQEGDTVFAFWRAEGWRVPPDWDKRPVSKEDIRHITKDTCMFPPYWLDKNCPGCPWYADCTRLVKGVYRK